jgi:hypothetical protein
MKEELHIDLLEVFVKHQLVPEISLRNEKIRMEYRQMKEEGIKPKDARFSLAEKYFISEKNIESILYKKRNSYELISQRQ